MTTRTFPVPSMTGRILAGLLAACLWLAAAAAATPAEVQSLMKKGELQAALEVADAGLEQDADNIEMRFLRGLILTRLERFDAAEKEFETLIEKHPKLPEPYNNLAVVYAAQGEYEKARETLLSAINTHPSYATAYENIGDIYAKMASDAYNQALQLDTENTAAREKLALVNDLFSAEQAGSASVAAAPGPAAAEAAQPGLEPARPTSEMPGPVMTEPKLSDRKTEGGPKADPPVKQAAGEKKQKVAAAAPAAESKAPAPEPEKKKQPDTREIVQAVRDWAAAWSNQDVDAYLGFYADSFLPPAGMSRADWSDQRRERLTAPAYIEVDIDNVRVNTLGADHAQVRFSQAYESNTYSDNVIKTLLMKQVGDRWLIAEEHSG